MARANRMAVSAGIVAWTGIAVVAWQSLAPKGQAINIGLPGVVQHFLAYLVLGTILTFAFRPARRLRLAALLFALAGGIELLQYFSPGREPSWLDAASSTAGGVIGVLVAAACRRPPRH